MDILHGYAMHYYNQYLHVFGPCAARPACDASHPLHNIFLALQRAPSPLTAESQAALHSVLITLEHVMLQVTVLNLVLKVVYQDYVLEYLTIWERIALFDNDTPEFEQLKAHFYPLQANTNIA